MDLAFERLALVHGDLPPGDVASMRSVLGLARQWANALGVSSQTPLSTAWARRWTRL